jgi:hypothetical protein
LLILSSWQEGTRLLGGSEYRLKHRLDHLWVTVHLTHLGYDVLLDLIFSAGFGKSRLQDQLAGIF